VQHHDRCAVVARLLQQLLRFGEVAAHQPVHAGGVLQWRAADEHGIAGLVVFFVADHALQERLLVERVHGGAPHLLVVERRHHGVPAVDVLRADLVVDLEPDVLVGQQQ